MHTSAPLASRRQHDASSLSSMRLACALIAAVVIDGSWSGDARAEPPTSATSPFTAEQAALGKTVYARACAACHGPDLQGTAFGKPLIGPPFATAWAGHTAGELHAFVKQSMPPKAEGSLPDADYLAAVAYILQANGQMNTSKELTAASVLAMGVGVAAEGKPGAPASNSAEAV